MRSATIRPAPLLFAFVFALLLTTGAALAPAAHAQSVIYVDRDASGANDGSSWASAYTNLQTAIDNATGSDQIWIAEGTYTPTSGTDRTASFVIDGTQDGLEVYGGFASGDAFADRNPTDHPTVLSGDIDQNDLPLAPTQDSDGDSNTPSQTDHLRGDNSYRVLLLDGTGIPITTDTVIEGLTITGGWGRGATQPGAGLYCDATAEGSDAPTVDRGCSPTLRNLVFEGNDADENEGGAVAVVAYVPGASFNRPEASPVLTNVTFAYNRGIHGGALYNRASRGTVSPVLTGVTFTGNVGDKGGAIYNGSESNSTASMRITDATFTGSRDGGAIYNWADGGTASPVLTEVIFTDNTATKVYGGAFTNVSGGLSDSGVANPQIVDAVFSGNEAKDTYGYGYGGAIYNASDGSNSVANPRINNAVFANNTATGGGAFYNVGGGGPFGDAETSPQLANVVFVGNTATVFGGAFLNTGSRSPAEARIVNATFNANSTPEGGALYNYDFGAIARLQIDNAILWGNTASTASDGPQVYNRGSQGTATLSHTLLEGGLAAVGEEGGSTTNGSDLLTSAPQFTDVGDPDGLDGVFATNDDGLRLQPGSPAIDAGDASALPADVTTDVTGAPRVQLGTVDLGAYEITPPPTITALAPTSVRTGENVAIRGQHFIGTPSATIGGEAASVTSATDTELIVTVPDGGTGGPVTVTTFAGTATSPEPLRVHRLPYGPETALDLESGDWLRADPVSSALADASALTMETWVRLDDAGSGYDSFLAFHTGTGGNLNWLGYDHDQDKFLYYDDETGNEYSLPDSL